MVTVMTGPFSAVICIAIPGTNVSCGKSGDVAMQRTRCAAPAEEKAEQHDHCTADGKTDAQPLPGSAETQLQGMRARRQHRPHEADVGLLPGPAPPAAAA